MSPSSTPYSPPERTTIERRPSLPFTQSRTWSIAALAADAADDAPRASMISAPRLPTRGMYSFSYQSMSTWSTARSPFTFALNRSGNIVGEWLPHTTRSWTSATPVAELLGELGDGAVLVQAGHRREALAPGCRARCSSR